MAVDISCRRNARCIAVQVEWRVSDTGDNQSGEQLEVVNLSAIVAASTLYPFSTVPRPLFPELANHP